MLFEMLNNGENSLDPHQLMTYLKFEGITKAVDLLNFAYDEPRLVLAIAPLLKTVKRNTFLKFYGRDSLGVKLA